MGVGGYWTVIRNITPNGAQVWNTGSQLGEVLLPGTFAKPGGIFACHSRQGPPGVYWAQGPQTPLNIHSQSSPPQQ